MECHKRNIQTNLRQKLVFSSLVRRNNEKSKFQFCYGGSIVVKSSCLAAPRCLVQSGDAHEPVNPLAQRLSKPLRHVPLTRCKLCLLYIVLDIG